MLWPEVPLSSGVSDELGGVRRLDVDTSAPRSRRCFFFFFFFFFFVCFNHRIAGFARTYRWRDTSLIPRRILPPQSLIVALTPRLDWRVARALLHLRRRGYQVSIIEVDPLPYLADAESRRRAARLANLVARAGRGSTQLAGAGIALASWRPGEPIAAPVEALAAAR